MDPNPPSRRGLWIIRAGLAALTLAVFWPVVHYEFVMYDDLEYVFKNPHVLGGFTRESLYWAFTTGDFGNWFPLTWLSHICDAQFYGLKAGGHHLTSLLIHTGNVVVLFEFLRRATGAAWRAALVAALFAVHPLRVESVAWVAERKDVLSVFFFMLTLLAYARYARVEPPPSEPVLEPVRARPAYGAYVAALFFYACGLMSKAMIVTLPCVLLLLDAWPFRRLNRASLGRLLLEKVPFLALTVVLSAVTFYAQRAAGAMGMMGYVSFAAGLENAILSYVRYIGKLLWPADLAVLYFYGPMPMWQVASALALLLLLTAGAVWVGLRRPYVLVGWLWFLGTLVPALGLVQVGEQSMADRFTYVPCIGLLVLLVWWAADLAAGRPRLISALAGAALLVIATLAVAARHQLAYWKDTDTLFKHDIAVTGGTGVIFNNLGVIQGNLGHWPEAQILFSNALIRQPLFKLARVNLAWTLANEGKTAEAFGQLTNLDHTLEALGHQMLAQTFAAQKKIAEATTQYLASVTLSPTNTEYRESLGSYLSQQHRTAEAVEQFSALLWLRGDAESHWRLALALLEDGQTESAIEQYREAIRLRPDWPEPLNDLAWTLATDRNAALRNGAEAVRLAERARALNGSKEARFFGTLDAAYAEAGQFPEAIATAEKTLELAQKTKDQEVAKAATDRLALYRAGRAYHQP